MSTHITKVPYTKLRDLISTDLVGTLSDKDSGALESYLSQSKTVWIGTENGKLLAFWGVVLPTLISDRAYLWLYTTLALNEHKFVFIRHSQIVIRDMLEDYPLIVGHCVLGETKSIRWLTWLGAKFAHPEGRLVPFEIRAV